MASVMPSVAVLLGVVLICTRRGVGATYVAPSGVNWSERPTQVLSFNEPDTNVTVVLVGCLHYSPHSARKLVTTVNEIARTGNLYSVIIEMCKPRWGEVRGLNLRKSGMSRRAWKQAKVSGLVNGPFRHNISPPKITWDLCTLQSEMELAQTLANLFEADLVLGDIALPTLHQKLISSLLESIRMVFNPLSWATFLTTMFKS